MRHHVGSPACDLDDPRCQDGMEPDPDWNRRHSDPAYCVGLYRGFSIKPWERRERCAHCGQPSNLHKEEQ